MTLPRERLRPAADSISAGKLEQAEALLRRLLSREPGDAVANGMLAYVLSARGDPRGATYFLERALAVEPRHADLLNNLGNARLAMGEGRAAEAAFRRALDADSGHLSAALSLSMMLTSAGRVDEAEDVCRAQLQRHPHHPLVLCNLGVAVRNAGRVEEAAAVHREAAALAPHDPRVLSTLAMTLVYSSQDAAEVFEAHARYGAACAAPSARPKGTSDPEKRLRIGIVSGDLRTHSVAFFIEPWMASRDRSAADVVCYSTTPTNTGDSITARLMSLADVWRQASTSGPPEILAAQVQRDGVDILIDLTGHTSGNRLDVFALRPAPVQVSYLGYAHSTGMREVDYRMVDGVTDPPGAEAYATERLWRLEPCFLCYRPPALEPSQPVRANRIGPEFVFGSFNAAAKLGPATVDLWTRVVREVPGARLLLKGDVIGNPRVRRDLTARFVAAGLDASLLDLAAHTPSIHEHLSLYSRVDCALDPIPYNGTTTTCEALFMGVPVVTLEGRAHAGRVGASLLRAAGLPELVARDHQQYVTIARDLAADPARFNELRSGLRERLLGSVLCDAARFAGVFDVALREMWRAKCTR